MSFSRMISYNCISLEELIWISLERKAGKGIIRIDLSKTDTKGDQKLEDIIANTDVKITAMNGIIEKDIPQISFLVPTGMPWNSMLRKRVACLVLKTSPSHWQNFFVIMQIKEPYVHIAYLLSTRKSAWLHFSDTLNNALLYLICCLLPFISFDFVWFWDSFFLRSGSYRMREDEYYGGYGGDRSYYGLNDSR